MAIIAVVFLALAGCGSGGGSSSSSPSSKFPAGLKMAVAMNEGAEIKVLKIVSARQVTTMPDGTVVWQGTYEGKLRGTSQSFTRGFSVQIR